MARQRPRALTVKASKTNFFHRPLFEQHGLVDCLSIAEALFRREREVGTALRAAGFSTEAEWLGRDAVRFHVPHLRKDALRILHGAYRRHWGGEPPSEVLFGWDLPYPRLDTLRLLHVQKGSGPALWVLPEGIALGRSEERSCESRQRLVLLETGIIRRRGGQEVRAGLLLGTEAASNLWWRAETRAAAKRLSRMRQADLARAVEAGEWLATDSGQSRRFWDLVWRRRQATLCRRETWSGLAEGGVDRAAETDDLLLPQPYAIPFYHINQLPALHEAAVQGRAMVSLLGDESREEMSDLLETLRLRYGYPRIERRGRPRKGIDLVEEIGRLVDVKKWPVYQVEKHRGIPRSTVYGLLKRYRSSRTREA